MIESKENHFNSLQMGIRGMASTWILAGFTGIAFFIKSSDTDSTIYLKIFSSFSLINLICLMIVVGLFILWVLDQLVYQRLLNACFVAGLYDEFLDPQTPPIRTLMVVGSEHKGMTRWFNLFYFLPMMVFNLLSVACWCLEFFLRVGDEKTFLTSSILGIILFIATIYIWNFIYSEKQQTPFVNLIKSFDKPKFTNIYLNDNAEQVIRRYELSKSTVSQEKD